MKYACVMNEMRTNWMNVSFIIVALILSAKMCSSSNSEHEDYSSVHENPAEMFRKVIGVDGGSNITSGRGRVSSYLLALYAALGGYGDSQKHSSESFKIRSFRGLKGGKGRFIFPLTNVNKDHVDRVEIAFKLDNTNRDGIVGQNVTLFVHDGLSDTTTYVAHTYANYLIFDISDQKNALQGNITIDRSLRAAEGKIRISRRNDPVLLIYENIRYNPLIAQEERAIRSKRHVNDMFNQFSGETDLFSCRKYDWYIDMSVFDLNWWIQPQYYNAGYCYGRCLFPLTIEGTNSTSYSFMKNFYHYQTSFIDENVPKACCTPIEFEPLIIIYIDNNMQPSIMTVSDMRVKSCGCR